MKRASIKDIARIAGVSVATVSYVLNKKEGSRISQQTKEKILEIADSINYVPNKIAKSLKMSRSKLIGLILADISNGFYSTMARCIEDEAIKLGYTLLIGSSDENPEKFKQLTELFAEHQVDGMIVAPIIDSNDTLKKLIKDEYPVVTIDRYLKDIHLPGVLVNNFEVSEQVFDFLKAKNFEEILYVGYSTEVPHLLDRQYGFEKHFPESGISYKKVLVGMENRKEEIHNALEKQLDLSKRTAVYFTSNKLGIAGMSYFIKHHIKVPEDLSMITFDEAEAYELFPIELTYVKQPLKDMAKTIIKLIDDEITCYKKNSERVTFKAKLIHKDSVK